MKPRRRVENKWAEKVTSVSPRGILFRKWVNGLDSTPDINDIIEDVGQGLAVVRHRQGKYLELVPPVLREADDEAHDVALGVREHVLRELLVRAHLH